MQYHDKERRLDMSFGNLPDFFQNSSGGEMNGEEKHSYTFKSFRLDVKERQLLDNNIPVPLAPKIFDVLVALVERSGHLVEKDELLKLVWADSFVEEVNVARSVHALRRVLGENGDGDKFIETVPKKGYRFVAKVTEVVPPDKRQSTATDDFVDDANEQLPSTSGLQPTVDKPKLKTRVILFSVGFLTAVSLIVLLSFNFRSTGLGVRSIAVLPLKPIDAARRDVAYEVGIADSLINRLSSTRGLIVRPLDATRKYSAIEQDPIAAGREQKTDYVLASNYQIADGKIRITSQLMNVQSGLTEEDFKVEVDLSRIFSVQDEVAENIGASLLKKFNQQANSLLAKRGTNNEEAYRLYLQGRNLTMWGSGTDRKKAIEHFEQAIRLDPNYALAYARMANAYIWLDAVDNAVPRVEKITEIINRAFELDNDLAEAYVARGQLSLAFEWNLAAAEKDLLRAIELEPNNDTAHWLYALLLAARKQFDEALISIDTAQAIDPSATRYMMHRARILYYARRYDEAVV